MGENIKRKNGGYNEHQGQAQTERTDNKRKRSGQGASGKVER